MCDKFNIDIHTISDEGFKLTITMLNKLRLKSMVP